MRKDMIKILGWTLLLCFLFNSTQVYAESKKSNKSNTTHRSKKLEPDAQIYSAQGNEKFDIIPDGFYKWMIGGGFKKGEGTITFEERAENFKLVFRCIDTGKIIFTDYYVLAGPRSDEKNETQGVKSLTFKMQLNSKHSYSIEIENLDSVIISGEINVKYARD